MLFKNYKPIVYCELIYSAFSENGQLLAKNLSSIKSRLNILSQGIVDHVGLRRATFYTSL